MSPAIPHFSLLLPLPSLPVFFAAFLRLEFAREMRLASVLVASSCMLGGRLPACSALAAPPFWPRASPLSGFAVGVLSGRLLLRWLWVGFCSLLAIAGTVPTTGYSHHVCACSAHRCASVINARARFDIEREQNLFGLGIAHHFTGPALSLISACTLGLGVTASNRTAIADPGTLDFRPKPLGIKQEIAGIPKQNLFGDQGKYDRGAFKTEEVGDAVAPQQQRQKQPQPQRHQGAIKKNLDLSHILPLRKLIRPRHS